MKIIEVELVNHVVIPPSFHILLKDRSDVICIDGLNGSGKSFLINNIHPLSSNRRFKDRYPILKGKPGMKRIVYEIDTDKNLEVIHEYTVNGKRHSCKSYCNLITDGKIEELNPTGHTGNFETIIRKYLFFDNETFVCSFLSPKADSIVNATSAKRKDILKNTMKSSKLLEKVIDKNREILLEANSSVKIYNKQMEDAYKNLPYKSIKEFENVITTLYTDVQGIILKKNISVEHRDDLVKELARYQSMDINSIDKLSSYIEVLETLELSGMKEAFEKLDHKRKHMGVLEYQLNVNKKRSIDLDEKIENHCDISSIDKKISDYETEIEEHSNVIYKIVSKYDDLFSLLSKLEQLKSLVLILGDVVITGININSDLNDQLNSISNRIREYKLFVEDFNNKLKSSGDTVEKINISKSDNCDNCDLYIKYVRNGKFIKDNLDKFNIYVDEIYDMECLVENLNRLIKIKYDISGILNEITSTTKLTKLKHLTLSNADMLVKESMYSSNVTVIIENYIERIKFLNTRTVKLKDELSDLYKLKSKSSDGNIAELIEEKKVLDSNTKIIVDSMRDDLAFIDIFDEFNITRGSLYDNMSMVELKYKHMELSNLSRTVRKIDMEIKQLDSSIELFDKEIYDKNKKITSFQENMRMLENLNSYLVEKKMESTKHMLLKDILEKRIPLKLMETNMSFIENMVNSIMEENEINLSIDILIEENDVRIEVTTRNQTVEDIAMCSSGELCLLGVVLNAVLMHIIGYSIISFDEMDSNLDVVYRESFHNVIYSILEKLNIEQVFCVSHNISFDMNVGHIVIGEYDKDRLHGDIIEYN